MAIEIKNQKDNYISDTKIREEVLYAADHSMTYTYFKGTKIDIVSDFKKDKDRVIKVKVEDIYE